MHRIFFFLIISLFLLSGCSIRQSQENPYHQITMQEALEMMQAQTDHLILDVRTAEEYRSGHIPDAVNIPNETIGSSAIPNLPNKDQRIFVYCRSGARSAQACAALRHLGYDNTKDLGGIDRYRGKVETSA